jgi:hypothetical protein
LLGNRLFGFRWLATGSLVFVGWQRAIFLGCWQPPFSGSSDSNKRAAASAGGAPQRQGCGGRAARACRNLEGAPNGTPPSSMRPSCAGLLGIAAAAAAAEAAIGHQLALAWGQHQPSPPFLSRCVPSQWGGLVSQHGVLATGYLVFVGWQRGIFLGCWQLPLCECGCGCGCGCVLGGLMAVSLGHSGACEPAGDCLATGFLVFVGWQRGIWFSLVGNGVFFWGVGNSPCVSVGVGVGVCWVG